MWKPAWKAGSTNSFLPSGRKRPPLNPGDRLAEHCMAGRQHEPSPQGLTSTASIRLRVDYRNRCSSDFRTSLEADRNSPCVDGSLLARDFLKLCSRWSVRPCVRPVGAAHMTAGHNAFREHRSRPKTRARSASAKVGFPVSRYRPAVALLHVRPSQLVSRSTIAALGSIKRSARDIARRWS